MKGTKLLLLLVGLAEVLLYFPIGPLASFCLTLSPFLLSALGLPCTWILLYSVTNIQTDTILNMAPALTSNDTASDVPATKSQVSRTIFPDGIKTSGQHPPIYDELRGYEDFPESIDGPTLWKSEDYRENPERWVHPFSAEEIEEISTAADNFRAAGIPLTGVTKVLGSAHIDG